MDELSLASIERFKTTSFPDFDEYARMMGIKVEPQADRDNGLHAAFDQASPLK